MNWKTFNGKEVSLNSVDHQHLSNTYWYCRILMNFLKEDDIIIQIKQKLNERFNGQLLPYRPHIEFKYEINMLKEKDFGFNIFWNDNDRIYLIGEINELI